MLQNIKSSLLHVCSALAKHQVNYLIIGGTAVGLYGYFRPSVSDFGDLIDKPDIDIWYQPTYENYFKVLRVMGEFEYDVTDFLTEHTQSKIFLF